MRELIEQKKKGRPVRLAVANDDTKVVDLMAALKRSLKGGGTSGDLKAANRNKPAASKTANRKARGSKRAA